MVDAGVAQTSADNVRANAGAALAALYAAVALGWWVMFLAGDGSVWRPVLWTAWSAWMAGFTYRRQVQRK